MWTVWLCRRTAPSSYCRNPKCPAFCQSQNCKVIQRRTDAPEQLRLFYTHGVSEPHALRWAYLFCLENADKNMLLANISINTDKIGPWKFWPDYLTPNPLRYPPTQPTNCTMGILEREKIASRIEEEWKQTPKTSPGTDPIWTENDDARGPPSTAT